MFLRPVLVVGLPLVVRAVDVSAAGGGGDGGDVAVLRSVTLLHVDVKFVTFGEEGDLLRPAADRFQGA